MSDLRKAAEAVLERWDSPAWEWMKQGPTAELMAALRARLAAPRPEPAFWRYKGNPPIWDRHKGEWLDHFYFTDDKALAMLKDNNPLPLYAAPPTAAPEPEKHHPGYILGNHWLETAYERVCAGEGEANVLRDYGLMREEAFLMGVGHLKAENERLRGLLTDASKAVWMNYDGELLDRIETALKEVPR